MEFVIIATVVLVLAMCLGADFVIVPIMFIVFLVVLLLVIFSFFVYSAVKLTGTKSVKGKFVRFGRAEGKKFDTAFYKVSDSEYPNVFPYEVVMRSKIYISDKVCRLRYDGKRNEVFDLNAVCCVIFGLVLSSVSVVMSLESVVSVIAGWILLGQMLGGREIFGCVLMFIAIIIAQLPDREYTK